ncbi:hypothetical protein GIB67_036651, partial [Kingdonia uniflora]
ELKRLKRLIGFKYSDFISPTLRLSQLSQLSVSFHSKKISNLLKSSLNHISICAPSHSWITLHSDLQISPSEESVIE